MSLFEQRVSRVRLFHSASANGDMGQRSDVMGHLGAVAAARVRVAGSALVGFLA
ncbi:MAG: hypothetical protein ACT4QF_25005 [Sporichthyaceae bacterium]